MTRLTQNFTLEELTRSQTAEEQGIDNTPGPAERYNLKALTEACLQPIRDHYGVLVRVTSGYRSDALNEAVGGSSTSLHRRGLAADIDVMGVDDRKVFDDIREGRLDIDFEELIYYPEQNRLHIAYSRTPLSRETLIHQDEEYRAV